ncbi:D-alanyl-D-alanine carboxypeptidase family protein [Lachnobacterium bovis]|uniref:D-alanyl-D-alanine carboxypeptidase (Penicillin-binding protein 5/6) n=1 Tax=Lachnobacterium bovis TaxID=140626 RepID=A0A1H9PTB1_9FIRM|nr:serine hydrolase [Lachnobacterium bovis]SER51360.1 D-alanyl-D-alanine carboxypeptidase (penicillin-binding protein 5/6) [Lachnobacterium bovis]
MKKILITLSVSIVCLAVAYGAFIGVKKFNSNGKTEVKVASVKKTKNVAVNKKNKVKKIEYKDTKATKDIVNPEIISTNGIVVDIDSKTIIARKNDKQVMCPASMTKILTVLVACEKVKNLDDKITITKDMINYVYAHGCSSVGFVEGEQITVKDALYGTILPSGADAALALATYVAGSQDKFVVLMNKKLDEFGLSKTAHFTNCIGLYDDNHKCSMYDMSIILSHALENKFCKKILSTHTYTTSKTEQHPEGCTVSNWFLRRIEDKKMPGKVMCAKTGFVNQSGSCAASYFEDKSKKHKYICVTAGSSSSWKCIYDQVEIYNEFAS